MMRKRIAVAVAVAVLLIILNIILFDWYTDGLFVTKPLNQLRTKKEDISSPPDSGQGLTAGSSLGLFVAEPLNQLRTKKEVGSSPPDSRQGLTAGSSLGLTNCSVTVGNEGKAVFTCDIPTEDVRHLSVEATKPERESVAECESKASEQLQCTYVPQGTDLPAYIQNRSVIMPLPENVTGKQYHCQIPGNYGSKPCKLQPDKPNPPNFTKPGRNNDTLQSSEGSRADSNTTRVDGTESHSEKVLMQLIILLACTTVVLLLIIVPLVSYCISHRYFNREKDKPAKSSQTDGQQLAGQESERSQTLHTCCPGTSTDQGCMGNSSTASQNKSMSNLQVETGCSEATAVASGQRSSSCDICPRLQKENTNLLLTIQKLEAELREHKAQATSNETTNRESQLARNNQNSEQRRPQSSVTSVSDDAPDETSSQFQQRETVHGAALAQNIPDSSYAYPVNETNPDRQKEEFGVQIRQEDQSMPKLAENVPLLPKDNERFSASTENIQDTEC